MNFKPKFNSFTVLRAFVVTLILGYVVMEFTGFRLLSLGNQEKYDPGTTHGTHHK